jgi:hypothetical protein
LLGKIWAIEELLDDNSQDLKLEGNEVDRGEEEEEGAMTNESASEHIEEEDLISGEEKVELRKPKGR